MTPREASSSRRMSRTAWRSSTSLLPRLPGADHGLAAGAGEVWLGAELKAPGEFGQSLGAEFQEVGQLRGQQGLDGDELHLAVGHGEVRGDGRGGYAEQDGDPTLRGEEGLGHALTGDFHGEEAGEDALAHGGVP